MFQYVIKRILIFIPTFMVIAWVTFMLSQVAPGDPVEQMLGTQSTEGQLSEKLAQEKSYIELREKLGLHLPPFYFTLSNQASPDSLHKIVKHQHRENLGELVHLYGNWQEISDYYHSIKTMEEACYMVSKNSNNAKNLRLLKQKLNVLHKTFEDFKVENLFGKMEKDLGTDPSMNDVKSKFAELKVAYAHMKETATPNKNMIPALHWYGASCQFHTWLFGDKPWFGDAPEGSYISAGFVRGDFGISYQDRRPVTSRIWDALQYTFWISMISFFLAYSIAIPIGVQTAIKKDTNFDKITTTVLFILYSLPGFWVATMLIIFLCQPDYLNWFPPGKVTSLPATAPLGDKILDVLHHMVLPMICWTYGSLAFISRQMRGGMLSVILQDYIRTARSKGLDEKTIIWKHAFRNSLIPIITMFASVFPVALSGSVILEVIFTIPGMGKLAFEAVVFRDYPIVFTVLLFGAILTMLGILFSDILYSLVDPRITFTGKSK